MITQLNLTKNRRIRRIEIDFADRRQRRRFIDAPADPLIHALFVVAAVILVAGLVLLG